MLAFSTLTNYPFLERTTLLQLIKVLNIKMHWSSANIRAVGTYEVDTFVPTTDDGSLIASKARSFCQPRVGSYIYK